MEIKRFYRGEYYSESKSRDRSIAIPASSLEAAQSRLQAVSQGRVSHALPNNAFHVPVFACHYQYEGTQFGLGIVAQSAQEAEQCLRALAGAKFIFTTVYDLPFPIHLPEYATYGDIMGIFHEIQDMGGLVETRFCH